MAWTTRFTDSFTGTEFTALPTYDATWETHEGNNRIGSGGATVGSVAASRSTIQTALENDQAVEIQYALASGSAAPVGVIARATNTGSGYWHFTGYLVYWNTSTGELTLYRVNGSTGTSIGTGSSTYAQNDVLRLECVGDQITVKVNGSTQIGPVTDATYGSGRVGIKSDASLDAWGDNFKAEDEAAGVPTLTITSPSDTDVVPTAGGTADVVAQITLSNYSEAPTQLEFSTDAGSNWDDCTDQTLSTTTCEVTCPGIAPGAVTLVIRDQDDTDATDSVSITVGATGVTITYPDPAEVVAFKAAAGTRLEWTYDDGAPLDGPEADFDGQGYVALSAVSQAGGTGSGVMVGVTAGVGTLTLRDGTVTATSDSLSGVMAADRGIGFDAGGGFFPL